MFTSDNLIDCYAQFVCCQMLTMHYLDSLVRHLRELGYSHLALPVLAFEDVLSRSLLENKSLKILVHSRYIKCSPKINFLIFSHSFFFSRHELTTALLIFLGITVCVKLTCQISFVLYHSDCYRLITIVLYLQSNFILSYIFF